MCKNVSRIFKNLGKIPNRPMVAFHAHLASVEGVLYGKSGERRIDFKMSRQLEESNALKARN